MRPQFATVGPLAGASATNIRTASAVAGAGTVVLNGSLVTGTVATMDNPRQALFTFAGTGNTGVTFVITGTGPSGQAQSETLTGPATATTVATVLSYKTITSVVASGALSGNLSIGTNTVADSPWRQMDGWLGGGGTCSVQVDVTGTVNYTLFQTMDDPNVLDGYGRNVLTPAQVVWVQCSDTNLQGATGNQQTNYQFPPVWVKVTLNSGSGSIAMTIRQTGK
jgi:hypothetical protein